ncbi:MAG: PAS domain S-box protein [Bacteroidetes bacterium]|nr:PAS domain S-box protein [Bacteroidota bacterium]
MQKIKNDNIVKKSIDLESYVKNLESALSKLENLAEALKESELRFKLLAEIAPVGIFRTDAEGFTNYVNPHWCIISGLSEEEAMGNGWLKAVHPDDREKIKINWEKNAKSKKISEAEYRFLHSDSSVSWVIGKALPLTYRNKKIVGYIGTITDVTALKKAEFELHKRLEGEKILSAISSRFINVNIANIDKEINIALKEIGLHADADRSYVFIISDDDQHITNTHEWCRKGISAQMQNLQNEPINTFPCLMKKLYKHYPIHIESVARLPISASNEKEILESQEIKSALIIPLVISNKLIGFLGFDAVIEEKVWSDEDVVLLKILAEVISNSFKRIKSEQLLRESEERNKTIVNALPDMFFRLNKESVFIDCSTLHAEKYYIPIEQFIGKKVQDVLPADLTAIIMEKLHDAKRTNTLQIFNYPLIVKGVEKWFEARVIPDIKNDLLVIVRDVTEQKDQQKKLEQKNEELEKYTYTVSHDLKSPLITINGFAKYLLEDIKNNNYDNVKIDLQRIINASNKLSNMLDDLLEISTAGQIVSKTHNFPLGRIIKDVLDLLAITISKKNAKIIINRRLPVILS